MKFVKYPSLENLYNAKSLISKFEHADALSGTFLVQEKIHGSCFCFYTDGIDVKCGKRTSILEEDESFFGWQEVRDKYKGAILKHAKLCLHESQIQFEGAYFVYFGELYGGNIQKNMPYSKDKDFALFDTFMVVPNTKENVDTLETYKFNFIYYEPSDVYLVTVVDKLKTLKHLENLGVPVAPVLFSGSFEDCVNFNHTFESKLLDEGTMAMYGLEKGTEEYNRIAEAEGVVISANTSKAVQNCLLGIKVKTERFTEKSREPKVYISQDKKLESLNTFEREVLGKLLCLINQPRYDAVVSKIGEVDVKMFGTVMKGFMDDVYVDFHKEVDVGFKLKDLDNYKPISNTVNKEATKLIRDNLTVKV